MTSSGTITMINEGEDNYLASQRPLFVQVILTNILGTKTLRLIFVCLFMIQLVDGSNLEILAVVRDVNMMGVRARTFPLSRTKIFGEIKFPNH